MSRSTRRECALESCENTFLVESRRPDKRFCSARHRKLAHIRRLEENLGGEQATEPERELVGVGARAHEHEQDYEHDPHAPPPPAPGTPAPHPAATGTALAPRPQRYPRLIVEPRPSLRTTLRRRGLRRVGPGPHAYTARSGVATRSRSWMNPLRWVLALYHLAGNVVVTLFYLDHLVLGTVRIARPRPQPGTIPAPTAPAPTAGAVAPPAAAPLPAPAPPPAPAPAPAPAPRSFTPWTPPPQRSAAQPPTLRAPAPATPTPASPTPAAPAAPASPTPTGRRSTKSTKPPLPRFPARSDGPPTTAPGPVPAPPRRPPERGRLTGSIRGSTPMPETIRSALDSLSASKLRSALTMVGIIIGVAAVIMLVSIGNGMQADFDRQFSLLANQITVTKAKATGGGAFASRNLTDHDVETMRDPRKGPHIESVSPSVNGDAMLTVGQNQERAKMFGVTHNYLELLDRQVTHGRWLSTGEVDDGKRVAVLGEDSVGLLWGNEPPDQVIGATVRLEHTNFKVVGVLKSDGQNDNVVLVPFEAARNFLVGDNAGKVDQIVVKSTSVATVGQASSEIVDILDQSHNIRKPASRDYNVLTYASLLRKSSQFITFLSLFIVAIAAISLVVGGIGVANIMLVAVTERTREIGIRKAIGAKRATILAQFLSEAVMLTTVGGVIGVGIGLGGSLGSKQLLPQLVDDFPAPILSVAPVVLSFMVSVVIGVVAGIYPAHRAGRMKPIDALRFE